MLPIVESHSVSHPSNQGLCLKRSQIKQNNKTSSLRSDNKLNIAVLGATGGTALAFLIPALEEVHNCVVRELVYQYLLCDPKVRSTTNFAVVRNETKLTNLLKSRNVPEALISKYLNTIAGNFKDTESVAKTLFQPSSSNGVVDIIASGIGGAPVFTPNPLRPTLDDPTICQDATSTVLEALRSGPKSNMEKPLFVVVSTTGISDHGRDIPIAMIPLYHWLLPFPHADKKKMEILLASEMQSSEPAIQGFVAVRPSLLTDGPILGAEKIRAGT